MGLLVSEPVHLVLDGRAITRPDALDRAVEHRGAFQVIQDHLMSPGVGVEQVAGELGTPGAMGPRRVDRVGFQDPPLRLVAVVEAEVERGRAPRLDRRLGEVDGPGVHPGRRARLEPAKGKAPRSKAVGDPHGGRLAGPAGRLGRLAGDGTALQGGAGGQDQGPGLVELAGMGAQAKEGVGSLRRLHPVYARNGGLLQGQVRLALQRRLHLHHVQLFVRLSARDLDRWALAGVEHPDLDGRAVDVTTHLEAHGVHLTDHVALGRPANGGVAGHEGHGVQVHGQEQGLAAHASRGQRRLAAGVARANHCDVI